MGLKLLFNNSLLWVGLIIMGLIIKVSLFSVSTGDYVAFLQPWMNFIKSNGYFSSLKYGFYDYTPSYIYILILIAKTGLNPLYTIKVVSIVFEFLAAFFVGKIFDLKYHDKKSVLIALAIVPLIPTLILNSSYLSQCDSIYAAFVIGSIYFVLKGNEFLSILLLGCAFVFKMQAAFILPFYFLLMLRGNIRWYYFFSIPVLLLLSLLPAFFYGRPMSDLLSIYIAQADRYQYLTLNFPNLYIWISNDYYAQGKLIGVVFTILLTLFFGFYLRQRKFVFSVENWIKFAFLSSILIPFILPGMHERYMYLGDILGLMYYLLFRKNIHFPIGIILVSLYSYIRCSRFIDLMPIEPAFYVYFIIIILVARDFYTSIKPDFNEK